MLSKRVENGAGYYHVGGTSFIGDVRENAEGNDHGSMEKIQEFAFFVGVNAFPTIFLLRWQPGYAGSMLSPHRFYLYA
jgi:hypothetical protein